MFAALFCCTLSGFAEKTPIKLEEKDLPDPRSLTLFPTAFIDGQVLTLSFVTSCSFEVSVVDASGVVIYTSTYNAQGAVITLPNLPVGDYDLEIEQGSYVYTGDLEIVD